MRPDHWCFGSLFPSPINFQCRGALPINYMAHQLDRPHWHMLFLKRVDKVSVYVLGKGSFVYIYTKHALFTLRKQVTKTLQHCLNCRGFSQLLSYCPCHPTLFFLVLSHG